MKRFVWSSKVAGFLLLNIFACAELAVAQLSLNPSGINFGAVKTGGSYSQPLIVANSGKSDLTVSQASVTGPGFGLSGQALPLTLGSGQSASFNVLFAPMSDGAMSGLLTLVASTNSIHDQSGKHNSVSTATSSAVLSGFATTPAPNLVTPGSLGANPGSLNFAGVQVGNSQTLFASLTNSGGSLITILQASSTGSGFSLSGLALPLSLAAGQSVTFSVSFAPLFAGSTSGSVAISSDASTSAGISLSGTATAQGQLTVTPISNDFGSVVIGSSEVESGMITASGSAVTVSSANVTGAEFSLSGIAFPLTLSAGQSTPFTLTFTPQSSGVAGAAVSFAGNAVNSATETVTGTGVAPVQHSVSLVWDGASEVTGYNVYRGSQPGGPYGKINSVLDASTTYTDGSVQTGQTYYYVTTSVSVAGTQSIYSNQTQAAIPNF